MAAPAGPGPVEQRCLAAAAKARLRAGAAAHLASLRVDDLRMLRGVHVRELALLAEYLHSVPRMTARWMVELAEAQGLADALREADRATPEAALALARDRLGWAVDEPGPRAAALGILEHLAEVGLMADQEGTWVWRGTGFARDLSLPSEDELRARELFGGTLAFYRACLDALPEVLRGKAPPLAPGHGHLALWDGLLGSPEQLLLRRLALQATRADPQDILDLVVGPGHSTACVVEAFPAASIAAIDFHEASYALVQDRARQSAMGLGVPLDLELAKPWAGWGEALPFPGASFDAVFFPLADGFVPAHRRAEVFAEIHRVLRPGGELILVSAFLPDATWRPRAWELRAQTWLHHAAGFAVRGHHGLPTATETLDAAKAARLEVDPRPWRLEGLVWVLRAPNPELPAVTRPVAATEAVPFGAPTPRRG